MVGDERKVLCSILGYGPYKEVTYFFPPRDTERTDFATFALGEFLGPFDAVVVFGVETASWSYVEKHLPEAERVIIPEVKSQREVDEAFRIIQRKLLDLGRCSLVLDLTHGYRHHPLFLLLVAVYLSMLDYLRLEGVYYAMLPYGKDEAEFLSLRPFLTLLETVFSARAFRETMHTVGLAKIRGEIERARNDFGRRNLIKEAAELAKVEGVIKGLEELEAQLTVNFTPGIATKAEEVAERVKDSLPLVDGAYPYLVPFLSSIQSDLYALGELSQRPLWEMQLEYARRCLELGRFTSAAINLREGLVSWACWRWSGCKDHKCETEGECVINGREYRERLTATLDAVSRKQLVMPNEEFRHCSELYSQVSDLRNKICHGYIGHDEGFVRQKVERRLKELLRKVSTMASRP